MSHSDITPVLIIMVTSGLLSTMNIWVSKSSDIRFSLNDVYMVFLMTGWMFLLSGIFFGRSNEMILGAIFVSISGFCIRNQILVNECQYMKGMIPHHSMAVTMSKKIIEKTKDPKVIQYAENIIKTQEEEIEWMKKYLKDHL